MVTIREPVVAGQFYPEKREELEEMIEACNQHEYGPGHQSKESDERIFGIVCPHAGYVYSGPTACHSYKSIAAQNPELAVIIGPNHFGIGKNAATMTDAKWATPLGAVEVDSDAAYKIVKKIPRH